MTTGAAETGRWLAAAGAFLIVMIAMAGCGTGAATDGAPGASSGVPGTTAGASGASSGSVANPPGAPDPGHSTLTIGDTVWTFANFSCAFGHAATRSDTSSFSGLSDLYNDQGRYLYMLVDIDDETGQDRYEGAGVSYDISIVDLQHPDAPEVDFGSRQDLVVHIDGDAATAEGSFDDFSTDGSEEIPGSFEGLCGERSRR